MEELIHPIQELAENVGTEGEVQRISDETKRERTLGYEYLKQIDEKLNRVLKFLNLEVKNNGKADN